MSDKKRKSLTLDEENYECLQQEDNASAVVNDLVSNYRRTGDRGTAGLELRLKHVEDQLHSAQERVEMFENQAKDIKRLIKERKREEDTELRQAREALEHVPQEADNPAVENWAEKLGMTPTELLDVL